MGKLVFVVWGRGQQYGTDWSSGGLVHLLFVTLWAQNMFGM